MNRYISTGEMSLIILHCALVLFFVLFILDVNESTKKKLLIKIYSIYISTLHRLHVYNYQYLLVPRLPLALWYHRIILSAAYFVMWSLQNIVVSMDTGQYLYLCTCRLNDEYNPICHVYIPDWGRRGGGGWVWC